MNLFGIGPGELFVILILALIVFGPRRLPEIGRNLGQVMREMREASEEISSQFRQEMDAVSDEAEAKQQASGKNAEDSN